MHTALRMGIAARIDLRMRNDYNKKELSLHGIGGVHGR